MKALTILQPWASLIAIEAKLIETRSWYTSHRGELAIHAGRSLAHWRLIWEEPFRAAITVDCPASDLAQLANGTHGYPCETAASAQLFTAWRDRALALGRVVAVAELVTRRPFAGRDHGSWTPREDACLIAGASKPRGERGQFWLRTMPDRSLNACKVRLFRLRRRKQYFISPHAVERYWERVDPNARALGDGATIQHILNELQSARIFPSNREQHILTEEQQARLPSLSHWPHRCRTRSLLAVCRTFRAVITVPAGEDAAGEHPSVATVWEQTVGGAGE